MKPYSLALLLALLLILFLVSNNINRERAIVERQADTHKEADVKKPSIKTNDDVFRLLGEFEIPLWEGTPSVEPWVKTELLDVDEEGFTVLVDVNGFCVVYRYSFQDAKTTEFLLGYNCFASSRYVLEVLKQKDNTDLTVYDIRSNFEKKVSHTNVDGIWDRLNRIKVRYTSNRWWCLTGAHEIIFIEREALITRNELKTVRMPLLFDGAETSLVVSDSIVAIKNYSTSKGDTFNINVRYKYLPNKVAYAYIDLPELGWRYISEDWFYVGDELSMKTTEKYCRDVTAFGKYIILSGTSTNINYDWGVRIICIDPETEQIEHICANDRRGGYIYLHDGGYPFIMNEFRYLNGYDIYECYTLDKDCFVMQSGRCVTNKGVGVSRDVLRGETSEVSLYAGEVFFEREYKCGARRWKEKKGQSAGILTVCGNYVGAYVYENMKKKEKKMKMRIYVADEALVPVYPWDFNYQYFGRD